jgi:hypothetical protein
MFSYIISYVWYVLDRQTNSFIENSIEAGILLGGNGIIHAMLVVRAVTSLQRTGINHSQSLPF